MAHTISGDEKMDALWQTDMQMPQFPQLEGDLHADVLIIGGGLAGILCAWNLSRAGARCALIEQGRIMGGVSGTGEGKAAKMYFSLSDPNAFAGNPGNLPKFSNWPEWTDMTKAGAYAPAFLRKTEDNTRRWGRNVL